MPSVIDASEIIGFESIPFKAVFLDTNILIRLLDPFDEGQDNASKAKSSEYLSFYIADLRKNGILLHTTHSVALEYCNHLRRGCYDTFGSLEHDAYKNPAFSTLEFKLLQDGNEKFLSYWDRLMKHFHSVFFDRFPIVDAALTGDQVVGLFNWMKIDYGDQLLLSAVMALANDYNCIFSHDADFYSFQACFTLLTPNRR